MINFLKKIIENIKKIELNYSILTCLLIVIAVHFIASGYSSFNTSVRIENLSAKVRANYPIRITDFKINNAYNNAISYYEEFDTEMLYTRVKLPSLDSYAIYDIEVCNYLRNEMGILNIYLDNDYLDYELINYNLEDILCDDIDKTICSMGVNKSFQIKIKYKEGITEVIETSDIEMYVDFEPIYEVIYYGIDSTNLKNKVIYGGTFTENIGIDISRLKVIMGWGTQEINRDEYCTYINGVLTLKDVFSTIYIYDYQPPEIIVEEEYKPDINDDILYTYKIINKNNYGLSYTIYPRTGNITVDNYNTEFIEANTTSTKSKTLHTDYYYGTANLMYQITNPQFGQILISINIADPKVRYVKREGYVGSSDKFLEGPILRKEVEKVSFVGETEIPENCLGYFDISGVEGAKTTMAWYFDEDNNGLYELYISYFGKLEDNEIRTVKINYGDALFSCMINLVEINFYDENGILRFDTSNNKSMFRMFNECSSLTYLDLTPLDTTYNESLYETFYKCYNLEGINLSNMTTANVESAWRTFASCYVLKSIDVSHFDTSKMTTIGEMFRECRMLTEIDVSNFNTSNVYGMSGFLYGCRNLKKIDLSGFDTSKVNDYNKAFNYTPYLNTTITIRSTDFSYATSPFISTSTDENVKLIINYTKENKDNVIKMIDSKSENSNVILGEEVL